MSLRFVAEEVFRLWSSGWPYIHVETEEEERALGIANIAADLGSEVYRFNPGRGLEKVVSRTASREEGKQKDLLLELKDADILAAVTLLSSFSDPSLLLVGDAFSHFADRRILRGLRALSSSLVQARHCVVFLDLPAQVPELLSEDMAQVFLASPDREELMVLLEEIGLGKEEGQGKEEGKEALAAAAQGLSQKAAWRAFKGAMISKDPIGAVISEKRRKIKEGFGIEIIDTPIGYEEVGGLETLKKWLGEREKAFGEEAQRFGLPTPKGVLLLGVQGCGKSISAKAVASHWRIPLMRLDLAVVFGGGMPAERALRRAIDLAERLAPAVLWIDEIEKGFAGSDISAAQSVAEVSRVLGAFTTWLQEKEKPVFVVATANEVSTLPPELLRRGRFDEIFFVDLPDAKARQEILAVHLRSRQRDPGGFSLSNLAEATENFSGAELEQVVVSALYRAFRAQRNLTQGDLERAATDTVPLFRTYEERVKALRAWAKDRARPAGRSEGIIDLLRRS